ncbi:hypothetical protein M1M11_17225 [Pseudomonas azerbaijanoccidens]|jgi:hypothetical protein|uniref:hypothetical protein n=1 Tax=Pseudomonas azerbaijanoccidentalis TaxID=2842347 RepID=UPI00200B80A4|nr:hypothetical protein [Pseudomonas azerbaijanoccidentalis]MCK8666629.1 hypothetical protein [Pseudomonas azerbaijanoccidentalis]
MTLAGLPGTIGETTVNESLDPKKLSPLAAPVGAVSRQDQPDLKNASAWGNPFKIKISLPGKDIGGQWLCRNNGDAMAYENYCVPGSRAAVLKPYTHSDGKIYLQDEQGDWVSYESLWNLLYMSYWNYAVAWKIEGNRLVRDSDGAVLTWFYNDRWPLADRKNWLSASAPSVDALTVEKVDA